MLKLIYLIIMDIQLFSILSLGVKKWRLNFKTDRENIQHYYHEGHEVPERTAFSMLWKYYAKHERTYDEMLK